MSATPPPAVNLVGPFVVRSRKGNFGNQDLESALRMALQHRQEPDVEFVETASGRRFNCAELIDALDRQDHRPVIDAPAGPPATAELGLATFRNFAASTQDLDLATLSSVPAAPPPAAPIPSPAAPIPSPARRSDRPSKRSDRKRAVGGGNPMAMGVLVLGAVVLGVLAVALLSGR